MQDQSKTVKQLNKEISAYLHRYFVTNTYAMAVQMKDGKYATKYLPVSEFLIEEMSGKTASFSFIKECMALNPDIMCLNYLDYQKNIESML